MLISLPPNPWDTTETGTFRPFWGPLVFAFLVVEPLFLVLAMMLLVRVGVPHVTRNEPERPKCAVDRAYLHFLP